tara:strand:- start:1113 stop:1652 length:540 start_codon:yes stop_codon:yes gene_type:complete
MAYFETAIQIDTEVDVALEISVIDSYTGSTLDCDVDGVGPDIEVSIDTSDLRDEIKEEFRETLREELVLEIKEEIIESIAHDSNPFAKLAAFVSLIDSPHKRNVDSRIDNATLSFGKTQEKQTNIEIEQLKEHIKKLEKKGEEKEDEEFGEMSLGEKKMTVSLLPPQPAFPNKPNTEEK